MARILSLAACVLALTALGCDSGPKTYPVTGKVTIGGQPAPENTSVNFSPVGEGGMMATGRVDASGNYTLYSGVEGRPGAMVGKYKVYLTPDSSGSSYMESGSGGPPQPQKDGPIPAEFTSADTTTKEVDVQAQDNTLDIEL